MVEIKLEQIHGWSKVLHLNSQAAQWYFCTTEGVFRQLSNEDVLK